MATQRTRLTMVVSLAAVLGVGMLLLAHRAKATPSIPPPAVKADAPRVKEGTAGMAELLKERAAHVNPAKCAFPLNDRRAEMVAANLANMPPSIDRLPMQFTYALELVQADRIDDALKAIETVQTDMVAMNPQMWEQMGRHRTLLLKATIYLRMAEEQNCCSSNNKDSCLLPIKGQGIHRKREGATKAIEVLNEVLSFAPDDLRARWLLNVSYMTLGKYPEGVPKRFLIPPSVFASEYPLPRFDNVANEAGVAVFGLAGGAILDDFDNDGRLDLMISHLGLADQTQLFHNKGDGTFEDRTEQAQLTGEVGGLNMIQADYNNDGNVDVLVLRGGWMGEEGKFPLSLLRNNGDGTFTDVTVAAGLLRFFPSQTAVWLDYDGDGWLDIYVGNESMPRVDNFPCHLFHNNGNGTFTDQAVAVDIDYVRFVKGVASADYDNDGRPDLYLSVQGGDNILLHNDGPTRTADGKTGWHFSDVTKRAGNPAGSGNSFGVAFFDYDNDGWPDLFVTGYSYMASLADDVTADRLGLPTKAARDRLYRNMGDGTFKDVSHEVGLDHVVPGMGLNFGDLDNDGWLDIYQGTGNPDLTSIVGSRMFRNDHGRRFQDVTTAGNFGHLQKGHAIVFGDIDNDGDQDIFAEMGGAYLADKAYSALYANPGNKNGWVGIELEGVRSNRKGIGARIKVALDTPSGRRFLYRTVGSGGSFGGNPLRQQIGIGDASRIAEVEVFWPASGRTQKLSTFDLRRWYHIREDADAAVAMDLPRFSLPTTAALTTKHPPGI